MRNVEGKRVARREWMKSGREHQTGIPIDIFASGLGGLQGIVKGLFLGDTSHWLQAWSACSWSYPP